MPPRNDPPLHPLDVAFARFREAPILNKATAAETAIAATVAHIKRLEQRLAAVEACQRGPAR